MRSGNSIGEGCRNSAFFLEMAKFRNVNQCDYKEIQAWINADPGHADKMTADFFLEPGRFHSVFAIGDEEGTVCYAREEAEGNKIRMHLQFGVDKRRVMHTFREAYRMISEDAKQRGFTEIAFESQSPALVKFMMQEFHFTAECTAVL